MTDKKLAISIIHFLIQLLPHRLKLLVNMRKQKSNSMNIFYQKLRKVLRFSIFTKWSSMLMKVSINIIKLGTNCIFMYRVKTVYNQRKPFIKTIIKKWVLHRNADEMENNNHQTVSRVTRNDKTEQSKEHLNINNTPKGNSYQTYKNYGNEGHKNGFWFFPAFNFNWHSCGKRGHYSIVCVSKNRNKSENKKFITWF